MKKGFILFSVLSLSACCGPIVLDLDECDMRAEKVDDAYVETYECSGEPVVYENKYHKTHPVNSDKADLGLIMTRGVV